MTALEAEDVGRRLARGRQLPAVLVRKLERRAGVGARARRIPLADDRYRFREGQRHRPRAQCRGAGVGDRNVHLEEGSSGIGRGRRTAVRGECLIAQQQAGQQYCKFNESLHINPSGK